MRFKDENCGNCLFYISKEETLSKVKDPESRKKVEEALMMIDEFDSGCSCVRYPEVVETVDTHWCGEWKKNPDNQSEDEE